MEVGFSARGVSVGGDGERPSGSPLCWGRSAVRPRGGVEERRGVEPRTARPSAAAR